MFEIESSKSKNTRFKTYTHRAVQLYCVQLYSVFTIEFSQPSSAVSNIHKCFDVKVPVVVGTTGWYDQLDDVVNQCQTKEGAILTSTNFSLGVNIFFEINNRL